MRKINVLEQNIRCCGDIYIDMDCINIEYELWFDVDKYFGTNTHDNDSMWINFYTYWNPDGHIWAVYEIDTDSDVSSYDWDLTEEEKKFFLEMMESYCKEKEGKSLIELWNEWQRNYKSEMEENIIIMSKRRQTIAIIWEMAGYITVEADSIEEAMEKVKKDSKEGSDDYPFPHSGEYADWGFRLLTDNVEEMKELCDF